MRLHLWLSCLWIAAVATSAQTGEERRSLGEAGVPVPLSPVSHTVTAEDIRVHIALPRLGGKSRNTIAVRSELKIRNSGKEPLEFEVGFPLADTRMPERDYSPSYPLERTYPEMSAELDGKPIPARYLFYADLPDPRSPEEKLEDATDQVRARFARMSMYERLSEEWGHAELVLDPANGQLIRSYTISWRRPFGAVVFPVRLEPESSHTLVVQHKQRPGGESDYFRKRRFISLRFLLSRISTWHGNPETTIDVTVPEGWRKIMTRPPPGQVIPTASGTTYRIRFTHRPVEELYVAAD